MARYSEFQTTNIYKTADLFRKNCLLADSSIISEHQVWRLEVLERIHKEFVATPDEGDRSFIDKFKGQIKPHGTEVARLAAELLCVYFLFPSNVGGIRKRQLVNEVLSWTQTEESLPENHQVSLTFANGIGSGGYGYNTRRPFEIAFLIEFVIAWKKLPPDEQISAANDPWVFQNILDSVEDSENKQLRHMLLHLLFPDHFERIASRGHKRRIITAFSGLLHEDLQNDDKQIYAIRQALEILLPKEELDFYWPPLDAAWYDTSEDNSINGAPLELIKHKKQIVLYGPPGTGKTFRAKQLAERIIHSAALEKMGPAEYFKSQDAIHQAIESNIHRKQLHPAYSYEDFVRGLHIDSNGATEYRLGYLPNLIETMNNEPVDTRLPHVLILDEMNRTDLSRMLGECFSLLEDRNQDIELPARNGNGEVFKLRIPQDLFVIGTMNLIDQSIEQIDFALRRRFLWLLCPFNADELVSAAQYKWNELNTSFDWSRVEPDFRRLATSATELNKEIRNSELLGEQYEIGHTYMLDVVVFLVNSLSSSAANKQNYLWNRKGDALYPVEQLWNLSLRPLIDQYLAGLDASKRNEELSRLSKVFLKSTVTE